MGGMERNALSEGDADSGGEDTNIFDYRHRGEARRRFEEDLLALGPQLDECERCAQPQRSESSQRSRASRSSSITLGLIPDRGMECGFGPPPPGQAFAHLASHSDPCDESSLSSGASARALAAVGSDAHRPVQDRMHAKLEILHALFQQGGGENIPAGPEILRYALDLVSSDTSLNAAESEEALSFLMGCAAELQGEHNGGAQSGGAVGSEATGNHRFIQHPWQRGNGANNDEVDGGTSNRTDGNDASDVDASSTSGSVMWEAAVAGGRGLMRAHSC